MTIREEQNNERPLRIGAVSYLNSKPLIYGLGQRMREVELVIRNISAALDHGATYQIANNTVFWRINILRSTNAQQSLLRASTFRNRPSWLSREVRQTRMVDLLNAMDTLLRANSF